MVKARNREAWGGSRLGPRQLGWGIRSGEVSWVSRDLFSWSQFVSLHLTDL